MTNLDWARRLVETLARGGAGLFVHSPGARNLPLLAALRERGGTGAGRGAAGPLDAVACLDERAAGYLAVGWMRGRALVEDLRPAVVACTSGTAVLNLLPAVAEAREAGLPLVVLSADRPPAQRRRGVNQTLDQTGPMAPLLAAQVELPPPGPGAADPAPAVAAALGRALAAAGPLQINVPFTEPMLGDVEGAESHPAGGLDWPRPLPPPADPALDEGEAAWWGETAGRARRGLVWACDLPRVQDRRAARTLALRLGWPLLADAGSGLAAPLGGRGAPPLLAGGEDLLEELGRADFVLQLGKRPVSRRVAAALAGRPGLVVDDHVDEQDPVGAGWRRWRLRPAQLADTPAFGAPPPDPAWCRCLASAGAASALAAAAALREPPALSEAAVARRLALGLPAGWGLFAGNSLPVRLLDQWRPPLEHDLAMAANRGASGIDGQVATAVGFTRGLGRPAAALLGDLALLHDLSSLALLADLRPPLLAVVLNNGGGGIFRVQADTAGHDWAWAPQSRHLAPAAAAMGLACRAPATLAELGDCLAEFRARPRPLLVECRVDGGDHGRRQSARQTAFARRTASARRTACEGRTASARRTACARRAHQPAPDTGQPPARIWLHGFLGRPEDWDALRADLPAAPRDRALRLPGHGRFPQPVPADLAGWRRWLAGELKGEGLDLVGYSLGGRLALQAALAEPGGVRSLVLIGAHPGLEDHAERRRRRAEDEARARRLEEAGLAAFLADWYAQPLFAPLVERLGMAALAERRGDGEAAALAAVLRSAGPAGQEDLWPRLAELPMPVLWLAGERDGRYAALAERAAARCPRGRALLVPGAGHAAHLEAPRALAGLLTDWWRELDEEDGAA